MGKCSSRNKKLLEIKDTHSEKSCLSLSPIDISESFGIELQGSVSLVMLVSNLNQCLLETSNPWLRSHEGIQYILLQEILKGLYVYIYICIHIYFCPPNVSAKNSIYVFGDPSVTGLVCAKWDRKNIKSDQKMQQFWEENYDLEVLSLQENWTG